MDYPCQEPLFFVLCRGDSHYYCSSRNHGVSLSEAEEIFEIVSKLKNSYIKQIVSYRFLAQLAELFV